MTKRLTPARFAALWELAIKPGPIGHLDKRTARALLDARLIEWEETTDYFHVYRATDAAFPVLREHVAYLEERKRKGRAWRSDFEARVQDSPDYYREELDAAEDEARPETPADRVAALQAEPVQDDAEAVDEVQDDADEAPRRVPNMAAVTAMRVPQIPRDEDKAEAAPFGSPAFADAVIRAALAAPAPAPLPKRPAGGSAIADAVARYRTPLVQTERDAARYRD